MRRETSRRQLLKYAGATAAATVGLVGAASAEPDQSAAQAEVPFLVQSVDKFDWEPVVLPVPKGATVTFLGNRFPHTVTSSATMQDALNCEHNGDSGAELTEHTTVDSPDDAFNLELPSTDSVRITFNAVGEFPYFCIPHCSQKMVGAVVVQER